MKNWLARLSIGLILLCAPQTAHAFIEMQIFDTEAPVGPSADILSSDIWHAIKFKTDEAYRLTSIGYHIKYHQSSPDPVSDPRGSLTLVLYKDINESLIPEFQNELFSIENTIPALSGQSSEFQWFANNGLDWAIPAGSYWTALEVRPGQDYLGELLTNPPFPSDQYARYDSASGFYREPHASVPPIGGFKITATAIPEPATLTLLSFGLLTGAVARKRSIK